MYEEHLLVSQGSSQFDLVRRAVAPEHSLFFESAGRPLYAVYHAPAPGHRPRPAIVHVHSLGVEQMTLYRTETLTARLAAALGFPVLRFHARGHGDSAGAFARLTLEGLVEDALAAADEALRRSGAPAVIWLGVRFGALAAAEAAAHRGDRAGLALWEPVHRPMDYFRGQLRGMLFSQVAAGKKPELTVDELMEQCLNDGSVDVHGYLLHQRLVESARDAELSASLSAWNGPTLVVQIQNRAKLAPPHAALIAALESRTVPVTTALVGEEPGWHFMTNPAWECEALIRTTAEWLDALD